MTEVYLDNSATTRCFPSVAAVMTKVMCEDYGNPSSMHLKGVEAEQYIKFCRQTIAKTLKVNEKEIFFTSGGTEADNLAIIGTALANQRRGKHIITTCVEHPAVLEPMEYLEKMGFEISYLGVDSKGRINLSELEQSLRTDTILVSIMHTNNEVGAVMPLDEAGRIIKSKCPKAYFHVDAVQGYGKAKILPKRMGIDLMSVSGHKIHGPKGIGFLYVNEKVKIQPIVFGGGQQKGLRSGTENVPAIAGLQKAVEEVYHFLDRDVEQLYQLREYFIRGLLQIPSVTINGSLDNDCSPHIISLSVEGVRSEVLLHALEEKRIYVSAGSACAAKKAAYSKTLQAMGVRKELLDSTIRISLSVFTTKEEIHYTVGVLYDIIPMLRRYTRH